MKTGSRVAQLERKEEPQLEALRTALKDARYVFEKYRDTHPQEAWETLRRILFNPKIK